MIINIQLINHNLLMIVFTQNNFSWKILMKCWRFYFQSMYPIQNQYIELHCLSLTVIKQKLIPPIPTPTSPATDVCWPLEGQWPNIKRQCYITHHLRAIARNNPDVYIDWFSIKIIDHTWYSGKTLNSMTTSDRYNKPIDWICSCSNKCASTWVIGLTWQK